MCKSCALGAKDRALVVNLRACGLAFEDAATNPVTLSEGEEGENREKEKKKENHTKVSREHTCCW